MRIFGVILIFAFIHELLPVAKQPMVTKYYFSTSGSDGNSGTSAASPWLTAGKLATTAAAASSGDSILFKCGDTFSGGYIISSCNSGVGFGSFGIGAKPIINGFTDLTSWTETSPGSHLWEASCNSGANLDMVLVNGAIMPAGRTPDAGSYFNIDSHTNLSGGSATFTSTSVPVGTQNWTGAEAVIAVNAYNRDRDKITAHSSNTITYSSPDAWNPKSIEADGNKFFIQKHPATLNQQNEWYYYPATHVLRMYSTVNPSTLNVKAATQDYFFKVDFRNNIGFDNIKFQGLDSFVITGRFPVKFRITNNDIDAIGTDAISLDTDSACYIAGNNINRCGNHGIVARASGKIKILNNDVDSCGVIVGMNLANNQQADGIMVEIYPVVNRGDSTLIRNNRVSNTGYCGIRFTGTNAIVDSNVVRNACLIMTDGGGIYTNGMYDLANNRIIRDNIIDSVLGNQEMLSGGPSPGGAPGIYLDDNTGNVLVTRNTVMRSSRFGIFLHNNKDIEVSFNNLYKNKDEYAIASVHDGIIDAIGSSGINIHDNTINCPSGVKQVYFYSIDSDETSMGVLSNNQYSRSASGNIFTFHTTDYGLTAWQNATGSDKGSTFLQVPDDSVRVEYNASNTASSVNLLLTYIDLKNRAYTGIVSIPAWKSHIWIKKAMAKAVLPGRRTKFQPTAY